MSAYIKADDVERVLKSVKFEINEDMFYTSYDAYKSAKNTLQIIEGQIAALPKKEIEE